LSLAVARDRARRISRVEYRLDVDLSRPGDHFGGVVDLRFQLADHDRGVLLDFGGGRVRSIVANGQELTPDHDGHWLFVPGRALEEGANSLRIAFEQTYRSDGTGLHRFVDPEDGRTYLYTYLWPYYANQVFPLFDQPNLKAVFRLSVRAPAGWEVISAAPGEIVERDDESARWAFEPTARIPSYVFSLHAGPYRIWESGAGPIPLRLMARQSLSEFVAVEEWFDVSRRGFVHYEAYYGIPYPFGKYDQLIVPDFQIGAMENVAAVTFGEQYVQRQASSFAERERRASVILHEMAHMWFGDLVTHYWWNGLWLNESFATQMASIAMTEATDFDDYWHGVFVGSKQAAYWKDSRVTTHPIEMPIAATDEFFSVYDAITYQKGSATLKQLAFRVGAEPYRSGVSAYLREHAYGNTDLEHFIRAIARAGGEGLDAWSTAWLDRPGFNVVSSRYRCEHGRLAELRLLQRAHDVGPDARPHASRVAFYALDDELRLDRSGVVDARFEGPETTLSLPDTVPCPDLVYPNHEDWGYFEVELGESERAVIRDHLQDLADDPFAQSMLFQALTDAALRGEFPFSEYLRLGETVLRRSDDLRLLSQVTASLTRVVDLLERLAPESDALLRTVQPRLESTGWELLEAADSSDLLRTWFDFYLSVAGSDAALDTLRRLLDGDLSIEGLALSDDLRWQLLQELARQGAPDALERLAAQSARDPSDYGRKMAIAVESAMPVPARKRRWLAMASQPGHPSGLASQRKAMEALLPPNQGAINAELLPEVLAALAGFDPGVDPYFAARFAQGLLVPLCTEEATRAYAEAVASEAPMASAARLFLREAQQANQECLRVRDGWQDQQEAPPSS
jgi:aminopeptidase N